ncbi:hypothetical protein EVAR_22119_1 [Eumeta japonica]|uniref:Uncharacterized protein n=1 Tax=Eumeta variegata TaxID=151549 RepID=A0A4C1W2F2_EUMVA|nr:hypothetical protein EVAR_22119_1 [Eumeta japonica]
MSEKGVVQKDLVIRVEKRMRRLDHLERSDETRRTKTTDKTNVCDGIVGKEWHTTFMQTKLMVAAGSHFESVTLGNDESPNERGPPNALRLSPTQL